MLYVLLGLSCSRFIHVYGECESSSECVEALGDGAICLDDGYCSMGGVTIDTSEETQDTGDTGGDTSADTGSDTGADESCTTHKECRSQNGLGSVCQDDGICSDADLDELPERCVSYPLDAFSNWEQYSDSHIIGSIVDGLLEKPSFLTLKMASNEINETLDDDQFVMFLCDNQSGLNSPLYADNFSSEEATQVLSSFLMDELNVPVVIGPGMSGLVQATMESTADSSSMLFSTAGGDGLTELGAASGTSAWLLTNPGRVWSSVGDDYHRLLTLNAYLTEKQSYGSAVILTDQVDLVTCDPGPTGAILSGCQFTDNDDIWTPDDARDLLDEPGSSIAEVLIFPYSKNQTASSQLWYDYLSANASSGTAVLFLSDNIDTNSDFISRVVPSVTVFQNAAFYFSQYAQQTEFFDAISSQTQVRYFIRGFAPRFDNNGTLFNSSSTGFYQRLYDSTNGMDASENPQSVFTYDSIMMAYLAILHSDRAGNKVDGADVSEMLRTFKSFNNSSSSGGQFTLTPQGIEDTLSLNATEFSLLGLSGPTQFTTNQDASLSSSIWEYSNGEIQYTYTCTNSMSTTQDTLVSCTIE